MSGPWFALYPPVGGGQGSYPGLRRQLAAVHGPCHVPVLPGRDGRFRDGPVGDFDRLADDLWRQLVANWGRDRRPDDLVLFGYSMGASLATEMAVRMHRVDRPPRALVTAGSPPPHRIPTRTLAELSDGLLVAELTAHSAVPELMQDPDIIDLMLPIWRADCAAVDSQPRRLVRLSCPVFAVGAEDDPFAPPKEIRCWSDLSDQAGSARTVSGGHADLLLAEDVLIAVLAEAAAYRPGRPPDAGSARSALIAVDDTAASPTGGHHA